MRAEKLAFGWTQLPTTAPGAPAVNNATLCSVETVELFHNTPHCKPLNSGARKQINSSQWVKWAAPLLPSQKTQPWNRAVIFTNRHRSRQKKNDICTKMTSGNLPAFTPQPSDIHKALQVPLNTVIWCFCVENVELESPWSEHLWLRLYLQATPVNWTSLLGWEQVCCWSKAWTWLTLPTLSWWWSRSALIQQMKHFLTSVIGGWFVQSNINRTIREIIVGTFCLQQVKSIVFVQLT